jgi:ABC-type amino acid transport system permease subunit
VKICDVVKPGITIGLIFAICTVDNKDIAVVVIADIWVEFILNISALVKAII